jgi:hypothetical protein
MSSTPFDPATELREINTASGSMRGWYYLECEWRSEDSIRGPFTAEEMRAFLKEGAIDDETPVRYLYSHWHRLKSISAILATPSRSIAPKRVRSGRKRTQEVAVLGALAIILELILVHWAWPT